MYQTIGHELIDAYAKCMRLPLFRVCIDGTSACQTMSYEKSKNDEVEDLYKLLLLVKVTTCVCLCFR
jgi:diphthine-ammonia ligase